MVAVVEALKVLVQLAQVVTALAVLAPLVPQVRSRLRGWIGIRGIAVDVDSLGQTVDTIDSKQDVILTRLDQAEAAQYALARAVERDDIELDIENFRDAAYDDDAPDYRDFTRQDPRSSD